MAKPTTPELSITYVEYSLDEVMNYFADRFCAKIVNHDYFLDAAKNRVVFKLVVEK